MNAVVKTGNPKVIVTDVDALPPVTASLWKNRIFLKSGRSLWGFHTFPSKDAAAAAIIDGNREIERLLTIHPRYGVVEKDTGAFLYFCSEYHYSIPMPWRL